MGTNYKGQLKEEIDKIAGCPAPRYETTRVSAEEEPPMHLCELTVDNRTFYARGRRKKDAEQLAACGALRARRQSATEQRERHLERLFIIELTPKLASRDIYVNESTVQIINGKLARAAQLENRPEIIVAENKSELINLIFFYSGALSTKNCELRICSHSIFNSPRLKASLESLADNITVQDVTELY